MKNPNCIQLFVVMFLAIVLQGATSCYAAGKYSIEFGLMNRSAEGQYFVFHKTRSVQRRVDESYLHGFTVKRKGGGRFMVSYSIRFPEPLKEAALSDSGRFSENGTVYTSMDKLVWDQAQESFHFSEDDPVGFYELSIFIDGKFHQKITYEVEPIETVDTSAFDEDLGF